jgi:hypothetical protein
MLTPTTWRSWHLHVSDLRVGATDQILNQVVRPALANRSHPWFFVRYWQYGPHIRLRVANLDDQAAVHLEGVLRRRLDEVPGGAGPTLSDEDYRRQAAPLAAAGEGGQALEVGNLWPPGVYSQAYHPELDRYGGAPLLASSEALFQTASSLALAFVGRQAPEGARCGLGFQATRAALGVLGDAERRGAFCRRAGAGWQAWAARGGAAGQGKYPAPVAASPREGHLAPPVRRWVDQLRSSMTLWRDATSETVAEQILQSHVHMLHNRLGLSVSQEHTHYRALESPR